MKFLVTGAAGFVGYHLVNKLLQKGYTVVGIDAINDYYDVQLKYDRLGQLGINLNGIKPGSQVQSSKYSAFTFQQVQLEEVKLLNDLFSNNNFDIVCNLAAQPGVRYSIENPMAYVNSNIVGFVNLLECCKKHSIKHLVYASSSSVYGLNAAIPFEPNQHTDHPVSLYGATKKTNELIAHVYSHLFQLPTTGLRFFTVYGPWGRPDMAYFSFVNDIIKGKPIKVFNDGKMLRDFTFIDDIVEGIWQVLMKPASPAADWNKLLPEPDVSSAPYRIYNIGNNSPVELLYFIGLIEKELNMKAIKQLLPMQPGDVHVTYANVDSLERDFGFHPATTIEEGIRQFVHWYKQYYHIGAFANGN
jgi:UDP-glucuronate 4-epimerase